VTTQVTSGDVIRMDTDGDTFSALIHLKALVWTGVDKAMDDQLVVVDQYGNEVWAPVMSTEKYQDITFSVPLAVVDITIGSIPSGVLYVYKE
jgi:hypothetical protein